MLEAAIRFGIFIGVFAVLAALEWRLPRRPRSQPWTRRWVANLGLLVVDTLVLRFTIGAAAFATAVYAQTQGWGLFNALDWPAWVEAIAAFLILDLALYLQHVISHALPAFWRLHRVHHADLDLDLTTGVRFHPVEILVSMVYKVAIVAAIGADPWVVLAFEAVLNAASIFTHANIALPERLDRVLRWVVVTPDMHRIHHSTNPVETNRNFGFFLSVWDRALGTLRGAPRLGQLGMELGLKELRQPLGLAALLLLPVRDPGGRYSFSDPGTEPDQRS